MDRSPEFKDDDNIEIRQQNEDEDLSRDYENNWPDRNFRMKSKSNALQFSTSQNQQSEKIERFNNRDQRLDQSISPIRYQDDFGASENQSDIDEDESLMRDIQLLDISQSNQECSFLNKAFIIDKSLQEEQLNSIQQDQSIIIKKNRSYRPLFLPEHMNKYPAYLDYKTFDERFLSQSKFSNFIYITPKQVKEDQQNNLKNVRDKLLDFQLRNQVTGKKQRQNYPEQSYLLQYRVNKTYPYYILNKVVYFHGLDQLFRGNKDYRFRGFDCQNSSYFDVELENFTLELGQVLIELINATDSKVNLDHLSYESILQLLKWTIKYTIMYPRYVLFSYLIPQLKIKDIINLFNWSLEECDYFEKCFHQVFQAYLSMYIGDNFDEFVIEFHNGQIADQLLNLSIDKVHKLFYYSFICCGKNTRNKIHDFLSEQIYRQSQQQLLEKLSQEFDSSFSYFRSIPRGELSSDYSNQSSFAYLCQGRQLRLESDYTSQNKEKDNNYFIHNSQECIIDIDQIEPNSILITNSVITATNCWKVILITDSDLNISIFIQNQGYARFYKHMDQNQRQVNQVFIQMAQKSENSFVVLHSKIQINTDSYQFCHSYCINQKQVIGICNIKQLKQEYQIKVTLTEIPFIASLLSNYLENLQKIENLNLQFKMSILLSDKLDILHEKELLQYIEGIWNQIPDDQKNLYVQTLRLNLIEKKDLVTIYKDLNELILQIKEHRVLNQDSRLSHRQKSRDIYNNQENSRQITNLTKSLNTLSLNDNLNLQQSQEIRISPIFIYSHNLNYYNNLNNFFIILMNLRSRPLIEQEDLQSLFREKRKQRAEIRRQKPEQKTNQFNIKHIDLPTINFFNYIPKYNLITGQSYGYYQAWNLIDDQLYENNELNDKLQLKQTYNIRSIAFMSSSNTIVKQCYYKFEMYDYYSLEKINYPSISDGKLVGCKYVTEIIEQIIFLKELQYFVVARPKTFKIIRTIFNPKIISFIDLQKNIILMYGPKSIKMFVNTRNTTKLVRSFKKQLYYRVAFNGRLLSHSNLNRSTSETTIIDVSNMKIKANIIKHNANCLQSLFIKQLGLFLVLYVKSLDIFDSKSFQMIESEQLPDNKIRCKRTYTIAYYDELIIFYQTKRKLKKEYNINKDL
ncbi:hypothetical protein pb186bvf_009523 [Paramecium bursaria]